MNVCDFANSISAATLDHKIYAAQQVKDFYETDKNLSQQQVTELKALYGWLIMNIFVGNEMCTPESIKEHIKTQVKLIS